MSDEQRRWEEFCGKDEKLYLCPRGYKWEILMVSHVKL